MLIGIKNLIANRGNTCARCAWLNDFGTKFKNGFIGLYASFSKSLFETGISSSSALENSVTTAPFSNDKTDTACPSL
jgi:hypothetical protein